jgi:hypothetical protein
VERSSCAQTLRLTSFVNVLGVWPYVRSPQAGVPQRAAPQTTHIHNIHTYLRILSSTHQYHTQACFIRIAYKLSRRKREAYGSGGSYAGLAGKGGSRSWTVSISSLRTENAVADCIMPKEEKVCKTFDDWHTFYSHLPLSPSQTIYHRKRHDIVSRVVDFASTAASN